MLKLIINREFIAKIRNKSFIVMTFLSPLLVVFMIFIVIYLSKINHGVIKQIAIHDISGILKKEFKNTDKIIYHDLSSSTLQAIKDSIISKKYEGLLYISEKNETNHEVVVQYISNESPSLSFIADQEHIIENKLTRDNFIAAGIDYNIVDKAQAHIGINLTKLSGEEGLKGLNEIKIAIGMLFGYLIMMFIIIYGNMVMRSVLEEKTSRIIEIIISSVKPFQLMMGKIIGTSFAGLLQFVIWVFIGILLMAGLSQFLNIEPMEVAAVQSQTINIAKPGLIETIGLYFYEIINLPLFTIVGCFLIYFIGGYFLYSSFYAAIGAAVDSETDSQQFLLPIIIPLILAFYVGLITVIDDPNGTVATTFSIIPLTSPIVMMMRIPFGVPWWQLTLSIVLLFATFLFVVWFAAKIYRTGILMYGKKISYKELFKWLKY